MLPGVLRCSCKRHVIWLDSSMRACMIGMMAPPVRSCLRATLYRSSAVSAGAFKGSNLITTGCPVSQSSTCADHVPISTLSIKECLHPATLWRGSEQVGLTVQPQAGVQS